MQKQQDMKINNLEINFQNINLNESREEDKYTND